MTVSNVDGFALVLLRFVPGIETAPYVPNAWLLWVLLAVAPLTIAGLVFLRDWRDGFSHAPREYLAAGTLWFYLTFQTAVFVAAFIEEFIVRKPSVYVTTSRSDAPSDD
ncbi:hypothetical protein [Natrinema marinum]|uniref:hypothetical protein n=1 Tax=Natrinema marinum TaxID=2961598 RepID=UPI0020C8C060|nr:hypothetical protein [Natrinema marinum]